MSRIFEISIREADGEFDYVEIGNVEVIGRYSKTLRDFMCWQTTDHREDVFVTIVNNDVATEVKIRSFWEE